MYWTGLFSQLATEKRESKKGSFRENIKPSGENRRNVVNINERDSQASLASEGKNTGKMFRLSKSQQKLWNKIKNMNTKAPPNKPAHAVHNHIKDYRPKGKTYNKSHYDPKEMPDDRPSRF